MSSYSARRLSQRRYCVSGIIGLDDAAMEGVVIIGKLFGCLFHFFEFFVDVACCRECVFEIM